MRTTEEIARKCDLLEQMIEQFLIARNTLNGSYRRYEADCEALNLFTLTIRNIQGVITLARTDLVLLPPAQVAARAAFEASVRAAWPVHAPDLFERETRWLAHLELEEDYLRRQIREFEALGGDASPSQVRLNSLEEFRKRCCQAAALSAADR